MRIKIRNKFYTILEVLFMSLFYSTATAVGVATISLPVVLVIWLLRHM